MLIPFARARLEAWDLDGLDLAEAPGRKPRLAAQAWEGLAWPCSRLVPLLFMCRKHPSVTFSRAELCDQRRGLAQGGKGADFGRCLNCPGPYLLDTAEGRQVLRRLTRLGRRTGRSQAGRR